MFLLYSELKVTLKRNPTQPCWTVEAFSKRAKKILKFKTAGTKLIGKYQASGMGTQKRHMLDHIISAMKDVDSLELLQAGYFESAYCKSKQFYRKTSCRKATAIEELNNKCEEMRMPKAIFS